MRAARAAACLAWEAASVGVRWRPLLSVVIVTHLVTRSLASPCRERLLKRPSRASLRPVMLQLSDQTEVSADDRLAPPSDTCDHSSFGAGRVVVLVSVKTCKASCTAERIAAAARPISAPARKFNVASFAMRA